MAGRKLQRKSGHRTALLRNHGRRPDQARADHRPRVPKAKELRPYVEKLITLAKQGGLSNRRLAHARLLDEAQQKKLFDVLAERYAGRDGGYTRVIKAGIRASDAAPMAIIELVDRDADAKGQDSGPVMSANELELRRSLIRPERVPPFESPPGAIPAGLFRCSGNSTAFLNGCLSSSVQASSHSDFGRTLPMPGRYRSPGSCRKDEFHEDHYQEPGRDRRRRRDGGGFGIARACAGRRDRDRDRRRHRHRRSDRRCADPRRHRRGDRLVATTTATVDGR